MDIFGVLIETDKKKNCLNKYIFNTF